MREQRGAVDLEDVEQKKFSVAAGFCVAVPRSVSPMTGELFWMTTLKRESTSREASRGVVTLKATVRERVPR